MAIKKSLIKLWIAPLIMLSGGIFSAESFLDWTSEKFFYNIDNWSVKLKEAKIEQTFNIEWAQLIKELNIFAETLWKKPIFKETNNTVADFLTAVQMDEGDPQEVVLAYYRLFGNDDKRAPWTPAWWVERITTAALEDYIIIINLFYESKVKWAIEATEFFTKMQRVWLYSDWSRRNSEFDIISDLDDINTIIFWSTPWQYWSWVSWALWWLSPKAMEFKNHSYDTLPTFQNESGLGLWLWNTSSTVSDRIDGNSPINPNIPSYIEDTNYSHITISPDDVTCDLTGTNWMIDDLFEIEENAVTPPDEESWENSQETNYEENQEDQLDNMWDKVEHIFSEFGNDDYGGSSYKRTVDLFECWPNKRICIIIEGLYYKSGYASTWDTSSIDYIITKSNEYLSHWAMASKLQFEMENTNFWNPFKDLNLAEIFSSWVLIEYKPLPFLDTNDGKEHSFPTDEVTSEKMLNVTYEAYGMDPLNSNSLAPFMWINEITQIMSKSKWRQAEEIERQIALIMDAKKEKEKIVDMLSKNVEAVTWTNADYEDLVAQFNDISWVVNSMIKYSQNLNIYVGVLYDIPKK